MASDNGGPGGEGEALKAVFTNLRNPHSHGGASNPPTRLSDPQQTWAIESCMTWIKSLVRRLSDRIPAET
jgi:hypothetical protein